jgi:hypothetical protein
MRARLVIPLSDRSRSRAAHAVAGPGLAPAGALSALRDAVLAGAPLAAHVRRARDFERIPSAFNDPVGVGDGDPARDTTPVTTRPGDGAGACGLPPRVLSE